MAEEDMSPMADHAKPKVFITFSGKLGQEIAQVLYDWLREFLQLIDLYLSEEDIEKGKMWANELATALSSCDCGIVCVTPDSLLAPWVHFEAGAIVKNVGRSRLWVIVFGLHKAAIKVLSPQMHQPHFQVKKV